MLSALRQSDFLRILRRISRICCERRLIALLSKSDFFLSKVTWWDRIINAEGSDSIRRTLPVCQTVSHHARWVSCDSTYTV